MELHRPSKSTPDWALQWLPRFVVLAAALLASLAPPALWAQAVTGCQAPPAVTAALNRLPQYGQDVALSDWQIYVQRLAGLRALMRQYPNDVFVQRAYIGSTRFLRQVDKASMTETQKADAKYEKLHEQDPGSAEFDYLYGLTLENHQTPKAIALFNAALAGNPSFELPHLALAAIYSSTNFLSQAKRDANLKAFLNACPDSLDGYRQLAEVGAHDLQKAYAGGLRALLENRTDADAVGAYQTLWSLEFRTHPPSEYPSLRKQVAKDLERIRALNLSKSQQWYEALQDGYKLAGDQTQADWAKNQLQQRFPEAWETPEMVKWFEDHKLQPGASPAAKQAYYTALAAESSRWVAHSIGPLCTFEISCDRLRALENLDDVPAAKVETAVSQMLKFAADNGGEDTPWDSDYEFADEVLAKKHLEPQRLVEFAKNGFAIAKLESKAPPSDLWFTKDQLDGMRFYQASELSEFIRYEAEGYIELKDAVNARLTLQQLDERLQTLQSLAGSNKGRRRAYLGQQSAYWAVMARLAELQNRKQDAMAYYEAALLARLQAKRTLQPGEKDELADNAHKLWTKLGGTDAGWQAWYGARAAQIASLPTLTWKNANKPLPPFRLTDLNGKTWTLADLKGKVVFLNFWASW